MQKNQGNYAYFSKILLIFTPSPIPNERAHFLSGFWKFYKIHEGLTNQQSDVCINFCLKNKTDTSKEMSVFKCIVKFWR